MRNVMEKVRKTNRRATFVLQLTAMVDMFTILIVFLLKSYSTSAVHINPAEGLMLPYSTSTTHPVEALKLIVSREGIFVEGEHIVVFENGNLTTDYFDRNDPDFIKQLYHSLDQHAEKAKEIAGQNDSYNFEGKIVMQADSGLDYGLLKKVMYTSSLAGYADLKLATMAIQ